MRVLHLLDAGGRPGPHADADVALAVCAALRAGYRRGDARDDRVLLLGPAWLRARAVELGLRPDLVRCPPLGRPQLAVRTIRTLGRRAAAVCCWSDACERAAVMALGKAFPVVRAWAGGSSRAYALRRAEIDAERRGEPVRTLVRPLERGRARAELGLTEQDTAVVLLGADGAQRFCFTLGLLRYAGRDPVALVGACDRQLHRAAEFQRGLSSPVRIVTHAQPVWRILLAADAGLWAGRAPSPTWMPEDRPSPTLIAHALAAGLPVVAPAGMGVDDLYPPAAARACLARAATPPELARMLMDLLEDPEQRGVVAEQCRVHREGRDGVRALRGELERALVRLTTTGGWSEVVSQQLASGALR